MFKFIRGGCSYAKEDNVKNSINMNKIKYDN